MTKSITTKVPSLKSLDLDVSFNDAHGYGVINALKSLASRPWSTLKLRLSSNELRDPEVKLMTPLIA
jgi:hypothetical protein